jgi:5-methylcytosine-specific restriction endonuclease McrA
MTIASKRALDQPYRCRQCGLPVSEGARVIPDNPDPELLGYCPTCGGKLKRELTRRSRNRPKISDAKRRRVLERAGNRCENPACQAKGRKTNPLTIDHRFPRSKGGSDAIHNLQALCMRCNKRKADREPTPI